MSPKKKQVNMIATACYNSSNKSATAMVVTSSGVVRFNQRLRRIEPDMQNDITVAILHTKEIPLTQGKVALVDDEDYDSLCGHRWYAKKSPYGNTWYAGRKINRRPVLMHRVILKAPSGIPVDHENGNGLDNRKVNLRLSTGSLNAQNRHCLPSNTSGYRGVTFERRSKKWLAQIKHHFKNHYLGLHETPELAAEAYAKAAKSLFGDAANVSNPSDISALNRILMLLKS